jgi:alpha-aminoadipate carrier protein LysW
VKPIKDFRNDAEGAVMQVCPECENTLSLAEDEVEEGEVVLCEECGAEYEIINTDPLELSKVEEHGFDEGALAFNEEEEE